MAATKTRTVCNPTGSGNVTVEIDADAYAGDDSRVTLTRDGDSETAEFRVKEGDLARYQGRGSAPIWSEAALDRIGLVLAARRGS